MQLLNEILGGFKDRNKCWKPSVSRSEILKLRQWRTFRPSMKHNIPDEMGIVFTVINEHFGPALAGAFIVRFSGYHGQIVCVGLSEPSTQEFARMKQLDIGFISAPDVFKTVGLNNPGLKGPQLCPFAILLSGFRKIILLDDHTVPLQNLPAELFNSYQFLLFGSIMWSNNKYRPKTYAKFFGIDDYDHREFHQTPACLAIDMKSHLNSVIMACQINYDWQYVYSVTEGTPVIDIACDIVDMSYHMNQQRIGGHSQVYHSMNNKTHAFVASVDISKPFDNKWVNDRGETEYIDNKAIKAILHAWRTAANSIT